ncbi:MAG TPA: sigma-54 dependent transcriptional regulator [Polyangiaceae bacterium]|nr:sigma-54 dependent transcriptional regulator [Polyangiaceae bacterium]
MANEMILIVDDQSSARRSLASILEREGYQITQAENGFRALAAFNALTPALTITDLTMPGMNGIELLRRIKQRDPTAGVVLLTGFGEVDSAVEAMREGALDYLRKPFDAGRLLRVVENALRHRELRRHSVASRATNGDISERIIGSSPEMQHVFNAIRQAGPSRATVLITGESGTGKELVAEAIHRNSPRAGGPLVRLNCAALSENLLESELFGHERGSFTGADRRRRGRIEQADGGTLFLDEIAEISPSLQVKLLRVLQERTFERVGSNETLRVDLRLVAATNGDLRRLVAEQRFREDLFYRLNVINLHLPALGERPSDIPRLATHFLEKHAGNDSGRSFSDAALEFLAGCDWPGNVRQLENAIERALVFARGPMVEPGDFPPELGTAPAPEVPVPPDATMNDFERYAILKTMEAVGGSTRRTAQLLGISVRKIQYRLREYGAAPASKMLPGRPSAA